MNQGINISSAPGVATNVFRTAESRPSTENPPPGGSNSLAEAILQNLQSLESIPASPSMPMDSASLAAGEQTGKHLGDVQDIAPENQRAEVVTVLGRHENLIKGKIDEKKLDKMIQDEDLPTDLRDALQQLKDNPELRKELDAAGDKSGKADGKFSVKDVRVMQNDTDIKEYADQKSDSYLDNYVPSDAAPGTSARAMNGNDAMRELFRGSESLPKKFNLNDLQKIADGSADTKNASPQLMAAAKYYVENPGEFQALTGKKGDEKVGREHFCDLATWKVKLSPEEQKTIDTLNSNQDIFFKKGNLTRSKLSDIANDPKNSDEVRRAATQLGSEKNMLFSMLDNSRHGSAGNAWDKANDKKISKNDLKYFIKQGSGQVTNDSGLDTSYKANGVDDPKNNRERNEALSNNALQSAVIRGDSREDIHAQSDMQQGLESQPIDKKEMGGGFKKALEILGHIGSALLVFVPGAGAAAVAGNLGRVAATTGIRAGIGAGVKEGAKAGGKAVAQDIGKDFAKEMGKKAVKVGAKEGLKEGANQAWQEAKTNNPEQMWKSEVTYKL